MSHDASIVSPDGRLSSGIPGLDLILRGGFIRTGVYIIIGSPGSGKTILANQTCFNHVAEGGRAIYLTLLAETHSRMLMNLATLNFFDPTPLTDSLIYLSGYQTLQREGISGLLDLLRREIRQRRATLLIVDGLTTIESMLGSPLDFKTFIDQLHAFTEVNGCTTLLLSHQNNNIGLLAGTAPYRPEYTMVDGIVELRNQQLEERSVRELYVTKLRGSSYLAGLHLFEITQAGLVVYPRTEAVLNTFAGSQQAVNQARANFGIDWLDTMLGGGLPVASATLLLGVPGSGKTSLGLHFLNAGASQDQPVLYFGFHEMPARLLKTANGQGLHEFEQRVESGLIEVIWQPPLEGIIDKLAEQILEAVYRRQVKRIFIDSFQGFDQAFNPQRLTRFFMALNNELKSQGVSIIMSLEQREVISPTVQMPNVPVSAIFDNVLFIRYVEQNARLSRLFSIIKERGSNFDPTIQQFKITAAGFEAVEPILLAEGRLTDDACSPIQLVSEASSRIEPKLDPR